MPSGTTRVAAVIGDPIRHSLSPAILNAGFAEAGLDWVYVALEVPEGGAVAAVEAVRALGIEGLSVTMPHKAAVVPALDGLSDVARDLGAVNCIHRDPGDRSRLLGHNTDGEGFLAGLAADLDMHPSGLHCAVIGSGGAARAVVRALAVAGAARVDVVARSPERGAAAASLAGSAGSVAGAEVLSAADLLVNATPLGMEATPGLPGDPAHFRSGQAVVDLVYHPARTAWLEAAADRGARTANGLSMLVHQAAAAFTRWTGVAAPVAAMRLGAVAALGADGGA